MLYIRTDANKEIAAGHVMRCIAIADALRLLGEDSVFIVSEQDAVKLIQERGFRYLLIDGISNNLDYEIATFKKIIEQKNIKKLLIDSYFITDNYLRNIPKHVYTIYLGSLKEKFSGIDLLINYSNTYDAKFYEDNYQKEGVNTLLGVKYAPLRKEFQDLKPINNNSVKNLLITTGSTDKDNVTLKIIEYLINDILFKDIKINAVIGSLNNHYDDIKKFKSNFSNIVLHSNVKSMANLIRKNQLAISAAGTTLFELCACGVPTVSFSLVKEQKMDALKFSSDGIIPYSGSFMDDNTDKTTLSKIKEILINYIIDSDLRNEKSIEMTEYIDGNGSMRIANEIFSLNREQKLWRLWC